MKYWIIVSTLLAAMYSTQAQADSSAATTSSGPVVFYVSVLSGDVEIRPGKQVRVTVAGSKTDVTLKVDKNTIRARFNGNEQLLNGNVSVEVPRGTKVVVHGVSGDVSIVDTKGDVAIEAVSGDVSVAGIRAAKVSLVNGDFVGKEISGSIQVNSVSGDSDIDTGKRGDTKLDFASTSGDLQWRGGCGKGCEMRLETLDGDVALHLNGASFQLQFSSLSGEVEAPTGSAREVRGDKIRDQYGKGEGRIRCQTFAGDLGLRLAIPPPNKK